VPENIENTNLNELFRSSKSFSNEDDDSSFLSDLDFIKFLIVAKRNLIWVFLIFAASISAAYLYLRYTSPVFQSSAVLKLEIKSKSDLVNLNSPEMSAYQINDLSGEIELIKSNLVLSQVADKLKLDVSYFAKGKILNEERYKTSPIILSSYALETENMYNQNVYVEILNKNEYQLNTDYEPEPKKYLFGEEVRINGLNFILNLQGEYTEDLKANPYFFVVNHKTSQQNYLISNLSVDVINPDAGTLSILFKDNNATKARDIVNMIDSVYLKEGLADKYRSSEQTIKYLEDLIKVNEGNMERYEKDIQNFIMKNKSTDLKSEVVKNIGEIEKLDKQLIFLREKQIKLDEMFDMITSDKKTEDFTIISPEKDIPQINEILVKYNELKKQRELLLLSNKEGTIVVRLNNMELTNLKNQTIKVIERIKKTVFEEMTELNIVKKKLEEAIYTATPKDNDLKKIQRLYGFYERLYLLAFDKKIEFEITKASTVPSFRVLSPPSFSKVPIYPLKGTVYGYASGIALILSFLLVVLQYFLHNTIDNVGELEKGTIAPVLGFVPKYLKGKMEHSTLVIDKSPKGPITEALRTIRTNIEFMLPNKGKRIISVTSTISGEGKTFVSINLAGVIALSGQKVIIIDMDMRKPKIHKAFDDENEKGISTILINKHGFEECIKPTTIENLFYIPSGPIPPNPSELILSEEFDRLLLNLKEKFDVVILDSPPVGLVTDGVLIMKKVDLPIYVIRAEYSKKGFEKNANRLITKNNFKKLSIILNDFSNLSSYGYGYKYGYGYGYGYYSNEDEKSSTGIVGRIRKKLRKA
jgi:tyrosine-protein kinase Etk/Wzc